MSVNHLNMLGSDPSVCQCWHCFALWKLRYFRKTVWKTVYKHWISVGQWCPLQTCDTVYLSYCRSAEVRQSSVSVWAVWLKHSQINWQVLEKDPAVWALLFNEVLAAQNQKCLFLTKGVRNSNSVYIFFSSKYIYFYD